MEMSGMHVKFSLGLKQVVLKEHLIRFTYEGILYKAVLYEIMNMRAVSDSSQNVLRAYRDNIQ